jgi:hypothetical protein
MATRQSQDEEDPVITTTYMVARQAMKFGDQKRAPGELVPEAADWPVLARDAWLNQGWLVEVHVTSDVERKRLARQWEREETTRAQLAAQRKEVEAAQAPPAPPPVPEGAVTLNCANCKRPQVFPEMPGMRAIWQCGACGQRQSPEQSKTGTLQVIAGHTYNHNRIQNYWSGGDAL